MEFENEKLIDREIEIGNYLMQDFSLKSIAEKTGLSKKILIAHIRNMMQKLKTKNIEEHEISKGHEFVEKYSLRNLT